MNLVMGTMFLVLPALWLTAFGWAGAKVGSELGNMTSNATSPAHSAGGKGGQLAEQAISKKVN